MVRSLWTAATGMIAQQTNIDTIANNLSNVNTQGYKTQVNEFKSLLYQTLQTKTTTANGAQKPTSAQVGLGVRNSAISTIFKQGTPAASESDTDFYLNGKGFFGVRGADGNTYYTRNGSFQFALAPNGGSMLANAEGLPVLSSIGQPIILDNTFVLSNVSVDKDGELCYPDAQNNPQRIGVRIGIFQFSNPNGLERLEDTMYAVSDASGPAINEATNNVERTSIHQGYLEASNVQVVDEMVNMIVAQRAYELNSKAITTSDEMLQQANNLKR